MNNPSRVEASKVRTGGVGRLAVSIVVLLTIWTVILPWISQRTGWQQHSQWLDQQGIDASAMYYTELPMMQELLDKRDR